MKEQKKPAGNPVGASQTPLKQQQKSPVQTGKTVAQGKPAAKVKPRTTSTAQAAVRPRLIPGSDATSGEVPAGRQEEAELDQTVTKAMMMIHGRKSRDQVIKQLHDPSQAVAETVGRVAFRILSTISDQKQAASGEPLGESILEEAAGYVVPELMKVGVAAGIFPFEDDSDAREEVGDTESEFDNQVRLAMLEAVKAYGEAELRKPDGEKRSLEAQDQWARGVAQEVDSGTADPEFLQLAREQLAVGGGGAEQPPAQAETL